MAFLQATSPSRPPGTLQAAIELLQRDAADSLFSASPAHGFVWQLHHGELAPINYDYRNRPRRQDIGEYLIENGSIYVFKPWILRRHNSRLGGRIAVYRMDPLDSFQIDELADLELFERLAAVAGYPARPDLAAIDLLVLDFDGVMTDNRVLVAQDGNEAVWCDRGDGWGIGRLKDQGLKIVVISTETNPVVRARCQKLGLDYFQSCNDKLATLRQLVDSLQLDARRVAYVGNDVNDLECLRWVGVPIAVADAVAEVLRVARLTTTRPGGRGAVREVADWLIAARTKANT